MTTTGFSVCELSRAGFSDSGQANIPERTVIRFLDGGFPNIHGG